MEAKISLWLKITLEECGEVHQIKLQSVMISSLWDLCSNWLLSGNKITITTFSHHHAESTIRDRNSSRWLVITDQIWVGADPKILKPNIMERGNSERIFLIRPGYYCLLHGLSFIIWIMPAQIWGRGGGEVEGLSFLRPPPQKINKA